VSDVSSRVELINPAVIDQVIDLFSLKEPLQFVTEADDRRDVPGVQFEDVDIAVPALLDYGIQLIIALL
jgi:hypothetical protein